MYVNVRGKSLRQMNFTRSGRAYDETSIPEAVRRPPCVRPAWAVCAVCTRAARGATHVPGDFGGVRSPVRRPAFLQALAAKKEVLAAKKPDYLGYQKPGWNSSTFRKPTLASCSVSDVVPRSWP